MSLSPFCFRTLNMRILLKILLYMSVECQNDSFIDDLLRNSPFNFRHPSYRVGL